MSTKPASSAAPLMSWREPTEREVLMIEFVRQVVAEQAAEAAKAKQAQERAAQRNRGPRV